MKIVAMAIGCLLTPVAAFADGSLQDIVVTGLGRTQQLSQVPDTVTLLDADMLRSRHLVTLDDLMAAAPGVFLIAGDQDPGTNLISVRGISTNRGQEPSVAFVVDGQPLPELEMFTLRPFDLARVELLKGPQGALFGRSASGGAIILSTMDPQAVAGGFVQAGYGNGASWTADGALNLPVSTSFRLRMSGSFRGSNGFLRNSFVNRLVDGSESRNLRLKAQWDVSNDVTVDLRAGYGRDFGGAANVVMGEFTQSQNGRLAPAQFVAPFGDFPGTADRRWWGGLASISARLGNGDTVRLLAAYDDYHKDFIEELDFLNVKPVTFFGEPAFPNGVQPLRQPVTTRALTLEARYTSRDDAPVRTIAGAFLQNIRRDRLDDFEGFGVPPYLYRTRSTQFGLFAQAQADLADAVELTAALRYDRDDRRQRLTPGGSDAVLDFRSGTFAAWQPKVSMRWNLQPDISVYVTGSIGFKQGGFNPLPVPGDPPYELTFPSEKTQALEVGLKAQALDGRVRLTLAGYLTALKQFQNTVFLTNNIVFSVPRVRVRGFDAAISAQVTDSFRLETAASYTDARVRNYIAPNPTPEPGEAATVDYSGKRLVNAPDYTLSAGAVWAHDIGFGRIEVRMDYLRTGTVFFELDNILHAPPHDSLDARLALQAGRATAEIWGKNISNRRWATSGYGQQQLGFLLYLGPGGPYDSYTTNSGRQWGASLRWDF